MSAFSLAWRNLVRQKRRTVLMGAVVAFGFAAFALAGGFIAQSFEGLKEGTIRTVGQLQVVDRRAMKGTEEKTLEFGLHDASRARAISSRDPAVSAVLPRIDFVGLAASGAKSVPYLGVGVDPEPEAAATYARELIVAGKLTGLADVQIRELNDRYLGCGIALASRLLQSPETVTKLVVFLKRGAEEEKTAERLRLALNAAGYPVAIRNWRELAVFYGQVKLLYIGIFGFVGAVLVVIVILSAAIVMTMAVTERTREIGTLRALGTRPSGILKMFLTEGTALAIAGCAAGMILALLVRAILNASGIILPPPPGATHGMPIHVQFYPLAYAAGLLVMIATMLLASYFPARRAARLSIVDALGHV